MSDHIKRLEEALTTGGRLYAGPVLAQDLRRTLADVERMRGALELIVAIGPSETGDPWNDGFNSCLEEVADIARQALSAPNTEEGE